MLFRGVSANVVILGAVLSLGRYSYVVDGDEADSRLEDDNAKKDRRRRDRSAAAGTFPFSFRPERQQHGAILVVVNENA